MPSLLRWRLTRGLTQPDLAQAAGTTRQTIGRLENGGEARLTMVRKLAAALEVTPDELRADASSGETG